jgi:hypothetical protein
VNPAPPTYEELVAALIKAKCARWTMGTCVTRNDPSEEWCAVCKALDALGYEPHEVTSGGFEAWQLAAVAR